MATPIGHLGDITLRAKDAFSQLDLLLCEDTRVTRKLLSAYGVSVPLDSYHEHNAAQKEAWIVSLVQQGKAVGLASDAGTPLLSDPGERLVRALTGAGLPVTALPGASAVLPALCLSGLSASRFFFAGFLPPKAGARRQELSALSTIPATLVFYESPNRLVACLQDMLTVWGDRRAAVARELTKLHEDVRRGPLSVLLQDYTSHPHLRGEVVIVVDRPSAAALDTHATDETVEAALRQAMQTTSLRDAVAIVSARTGRARKEVYAHAIALTRRV